MFLYTVNSNVADAGSGIKGEIFLNRITSNNWSGYSGANGATIRAVSQPTGWRSHSTVMTDNGTWVGWTATGNPNTFWVSTDNLNGFMARSVGTSNNVNMGTARGKIWHATDYTNASANSLYITNDMCKTWTLAGAFPAPGVVKWTPSRHNSTMICTSTVAAHRQKIWRSTNDGASWTQLATPTDWYGPHGVEVDAHGRGYPVSGPTNTWLMAGFDSSNTTAIWRSTDDGVTWTKITSLPRPVGESYLNPDNSSNRWSMPHVKYDPTGGQFVVAIPHTDVAAGDNGGPGFIYSSPDGATWTLRYTTANNETISNLINTGTNSWMFTYGFTPNYNPSDGTIISGTWRYTTNLFSSTSSTGGRDANSIWGWQGRRL